MTDYQRLEVAVGSRPTLFGDDVIYLDLRDCGIRPFVQHDMTVPLPFPDEQFSHIQAMHCLEHIVYADTDRVLAQWAAKLAHRGILHIEVPDVAYQAQRILANPLDDEAIVQIYGTQIDMVEGMNQHRTAFTAQLLARGLERVGLQHVWVQRTGGCLVAEGRRVIAGRKPRISILTVTKRRGAIDVEENSLRRQTILPELIADERVELIVVDEHANDPARRSAWEGLSRRLKLPTKLSYPPDPDPPTYSKLELSNNLGLQLATGEIVFFLNDNMVLAANCLQVLLETLESLPHDALLTTLCHHAAKPTLDDIGNLDDPYSIFRKPFVAEDYGFPDMEMSWRDPRLDQESVSQDPFRWEANVAMARLDTIRRGGSFDPIYDQIGFGGDNVSLAAAAMLATPGLQVVVVKDLVSWSVSHYTLQPNPPAQKTAEVNNGLILRSYLKGIGDAQRAMAR